LGHSSCLRCHALFCGNHCTSFGQRARKKMGIHRSAHSLLEGSDAILNTSLHLAFINRLTYWFSQVHLLGDFCQGRLSWLRCFEHFWCLLSIQKVVFHIHKLKLFLSWRTHHLLIVLDSKTYIFLLRFKQYRHLIHFCK